MKKSEIITILRDMQAGMRLSLPAVYATTTAFQLLQDRYDALDTVCSMLEAMEGESMKQLAKQITKLNRENHAY
jgi:hypothetical protein